MDMPPHSRLALRPMNLLFAVGTRAQRPERTPARRRTVSTLVPDLKLLTLPRRHASLLLLRQPELLPEPRLARLGLGLGLG